MSTINRERCVPRLRHRGMSYRAITALLRERIYSGAIPMGNRLPPQRDLMHEFKVSANTIQRALAQFQRDGFVISTRRRGSFVAPTAPHLTDFMLIVHNETMGEKIDNQFQLALINAAARLSAQGPYHIKVCALTSQLSNNRAFESLNQDILHHRLGGWIFVGNLDEVFPEDAPMATETDIPGAVMGSFNAARWPNCAPLLFEGGFLEKGIEYLVKAGRKRIGILAISYNLDDVKNEINRLVKSFHLPWKPYWLQSANLHTPCSARECLHLLFQLPSNKRPNGLVILNDNLLEAASQGMVDAAVRVPKDCQVVAHCNFPYPTPSRVPVVRLGYSVEKVLQYGIEQLIRRRQAQRIPPPPAVPLEIKDELTGKPQRLLSGLKRQGSLALEMNKGIYNR